MQVTRFGFHASHEQIDPRRLLRDVHQAEASGFEMAMCSDHFSPWTSAQGHSGYAWSWLGAALATTSLLVRVRLRSRPAVPPRGRGPEGRDAGGDVPGRFWVALGSGEASNEHITGDTWPDKETRTRRLEECVEVIRALLAGEERHSRGARPRRPGQSVGAGGPGRLSSSPRRFPSRARAGSLPGPTGWSRSTNPSIVLREVVAGLPRTRAARTTVSAPGASLLGAAPRTRRSGSPTTSGRANVFGPPVSWDTATVEAFDVLADTRADRSRARAGAGLSRPRTSTAAGWRSTPLWGSTTSTCTTWDRTRPNSSKPSGSSVLPTLRDGDPMSGQADTSDLWWKKAVIYCVDVETYQDSDGDGIGDLPGLTSRIDYLAELGITCLWLMPFYPTPDRDDGYDVTDLFGVDPRLGTMADLVELIRTAHDRGIRVIADLVVNHTSDRHPWFQAARRSTTNRYRDYYVWRSTPPPDTSEKWCSPTRRTASGPRTTGPASGTCTTSTPTSRT